MTKTNFHQAIELQEQLKEFCMSHDLPMFSFIADTQSCDNASFQSHIGGPQFVCVFTNYLMMHPELIVLMDKACAFASFIIAETGGQVPSDVNRIINTHYKNTDEFGQRRKG